jgi:hypothetical protein
VAKEAFMLRILVAFLLLVLRPLPGLAQTEPSLVSNDWPALFLMGDFLVDISRTGEFEAGLKDLIAELRPRGFSFRFDTYATDDGHYYLVFGLESFADVDRWQEAWPIQGRATGTERLQALHRRLVGAEIERVFRFWRFRADISFLPEKERLKPDEVGHYTWDFVWVIPGREAEFEALNREWVALSRAKKVSDPFLTYSGDLGTAMPVYVWFEYGKTAADYAAAEEAFWETLGDAGADLAKRTRALIRKRESKTGRYRPDLSYVPGL